MLMKIKSFSIVVLTVIIMMINVLIMIKIYAAELCKIVNVILNKGSILKTNYERQ